MALSGLSVTAFNNCAKCAAMRTMVVSLNRPVAYSQWQTS